MFGMATPMVVALGGMQRGSLSSGTHCHKDDNPISQQSGVLVYIAQPSSPPTGSLLGSQPWSSYTTSSPGSK